MTLGWSPGSGGVSRGSEPHPALSAGFSAVARFYVIIMAGIGVGQGAREA